MTRCGITIALAASAAAALTACSSSTSGTPSNSGSAGATSTSSTSKSSASTSTSKAAPSQASTPEGLASALREGLSSTRSAHITLNVTSGAQSITGSGNETLADGKLSGIDLTETLPGEGDVRVIQVDGKTYVKLPASLNKSSKPWSLVTTTSSDPTIKSIAQNLQSSQSTAVDVAGVFASAAKSIVDRGPVSVNGTMTTHYAIVVDVAQLPTGYTGRAALVQAGLTTLPIDLYVDSSGRPVQVTEKVTVSGNSVSTVAGVTKYNEPVTITAPPASQVSSA